MKLRRLITKRACVRLTLLLVAGAIVNVAVVWWRARTQPVLFGFGPMWTIEKMVEVNESDRLLLHSGNWHATTGKRSDSYMLLAMEHEALGLDVRDVRETVNLYSSETDTRTASGMTPDRPASRIVRAGWPFRSMQGVVWNHAPIVNPDDDSLLQVWQFEPDSAFIVWESAAKDDPPFKGWVMPYRPIWPGFAINTVFYAAILWGGWLLFAAPFALRRRLRAKRGFCVKCAYDLRRRAPMSEVCPECGWGATGGAARQTDGTPTP